MKKLLVTASTFPRSMNDTEPRFIYDLCREYSRYYDVTALVPAAPGALKREDMEGVHVIRYHYFPIHALETLCYPGAIVPRIREKKVRALLVPFLLLALFLWLLRHRKEYDLVHCNWIIPQGIIHCLFDQTYILTGLGGDVTSFNKGLMLPWKKRVVRRAKVMAVMSGEMQDYVRQHFDRNDTIIIPMGCSLEMFSPENRDPDIFYKGNSSDKASGAETDGSGRTRKPVVLFVGRLAEKKGCTYLIEAMKDIDAKLVIVGDGPLYEGLKAQADASDADIEFVGPKNKAELAVMYASCDVFCVPSVIAKDGDKDGMPVALEEAMASGAAVVGSRLAGIGENIIEGENGLLCEPGDVAGLTEKINMLLSDPALRKRCSQGARETAKGFDFAGIALKYRDLLENR